MVEYDERTALIVVDVQNDFANDEGSLYVPGADAAIEAINHQIRRARDGGALVVYTQDWHPEHTPHFEPDGGAWPVHCVADSWGALLHGDLDRLETAHRVRKGSDGGDGYSAFSVRDPKSGETSATELEALLREHGCESVVVVGLATDYCVKETVLDALRLDFETTVLTSAIRAVDREEGDGERAIAAMGEAGARIE